MTKEDLQTLLSGVPEILKDVHPDEIKSYFSVTDPELTDTELNILTANYIFNNLPQEQREQFNWSNVQSNIVSKYIEGSTETLQDIMPFLRIVHAQYESKLTVTAIE